MESLSETVWDVILTGTGLPQALLALALSRSGKKILHIDKNEYYGGLEAALSLQEAATWTAQNAGEDNGTSPFRFATIRNFEQETLTQEAGNSIPRLGFPRAYSLSLSPQLIYSRSNLLPALVSSKIYRQLEFLAVGSWWICEKKETTREGQDSKVTSQYGNLRRIPGGREDVFADKSIDLRSTRSLMKFLKLAADAEGHTPILEEWGRKPFPVFLESHLNIPPRLQAPLLALTSSPNTPSETLTSYALPRVNRHLTSIGMFGPGFGSVIPKWGGLAEIAQVACRAGAVGGGVYVLKQDFEVDEADRRDSGQDRIRLARDTGLSTVRLRGGKEIQGHWIVGSTWDLPSQSLHDFTEEMYTSYFARSITIISGSMFQLFPLTAEGGPPPAAAVVVYLSGTLDIEPEDQMPTCPKTDAAPVYLMVHSSDTGECPTGQCVVYAYTFDRADADAHPLIHLAVNKLIASIHEDPPPTILWSMHYDQKYNPPTTTDDYDANINYNLFSNDNVLKLPDIAPGLALEDDVLQHVRAAYQRVVGDFGASFMVFNDREGIADDGDEGRDGDV